MMWNDLSRIYIYPILKTNMFFLYNGLHSVFFSDIYKYIYIFNMFDKICKNEFNMIFYRNLKFMMYTLFLLVFFLNNN